MIILSIGGLARPSKASQSTEDYKVWISILFIWWNVWLLVQEGRSSISASIISGSKKDSTSFGNSSMSFLSQCSRWNQGYARMQQDLVGLSVSTFRTLVTPQWKTVSHSPNNGNCVTDQDTLESTDITWLSAWPLHPRFSYESPPLFSLTQHSLSLTHQSINSSTQQIPARSSSLVSRCHAAYLSMSQSVPSKSSEMNRLLEGGFGKLNVYCRRDADHEQCLPTNISPNKKWCFQYGSARRYCTVELRMTWTGYRWWVDILGNNFSG